MKVEGRSMSSDHFPAHIFAGITSRQQESKTSFLSAAGNIEQEKSAKNLGT
jgi:hypothetical protein